MIDDAGIRAALMTVLDGGPIPQEHIGRLGDVTFTPPDGPHLRVSLMWERKARTGAVLTEASGIWQVLVYGPEGTEAGAVEGLAVSIGTLYEPYIDGEQIGGQVRVTDVQTLTTINGEDRSATDDRTGSRRWVITPLQVDFRLELIPAGIL